jgi:DNA repair protein RAD5
VKMYYGSERDRSQDTLALDSCDVVITSYGVLASEWKRSLSTLSTSVCLPGLKNLKPANKSNPSNLLNVHWRRVILDEAHCIRNQATDLARSCRAVIAERRWVITGTPIQNKIDDLYSLIRFLRHEPWDKWRWWHKTIAHPLSTGDQGGIVVLRDVLRALMLRRTKQTIDITTGLPIVDLPPRIVEVVYVEPSPCERSFYDAYAKRSAAISASIVENFGSGGAKKGSIGGYAALFTLLMRLRQTCDHPVLVIKSLTSGHALPLDAPSVPVKPLAIDLTSDDDKDDAMLPNTMESSRIISLSKSLIRSAETSTTYLEQLMKGLEQAWNTNTGNFYSTNSIYLHPLKMIIPLCR